MKEFIIAEKPNAAADIAKTLNVPWNGTHFENDQYIISSALGHTLAIASPDKLDAKWDGPWKLETLPILPTHFKLIPIKSKHKQLALLNQLYNRPDVSSIINASDAGREGELIFRLIQSHFNWKKPVKRVWMQSLTQKAIKKAFNEIFPSEEKDPLAAAAYMRQRGDYVFGNTLSRLLSVLTKSKGLSAGRVQTPVLAMLVNRKREVDSFRTKNFYQVKTECSFGNGKFSATWAELPELKNTRIEAEARANEILKDLYRQKGSVALVKRGHEKVAPPLPYEISALQIDADRLLGFSSAKTLKLAQALYDTHKAITYPRQDNPYIPHDVFENAVDNLSAIHPHYMDLAEKSLERLQTPDAPLPACVKDVEGQDHHAIIPTENYIDMGTLSEDEAQIYDLICRRFLAALRPPAIYLATKINIEANGHILVAHGQQYTQTGWMEAEPWREVTNRMIPYLEDGDEIAIDSVEAVKSKTSPPPHYTNGTIIKAMKTAGREVEDKDLAQVMKKTQGLGTGATRADTIERLRNKDFIEEIGRRLIATDKGVAVIEFWEKLADQVPDINVLLSPEMTAAWEDKLAKVEELRDSSQVRIEYKAFMDEAKAFLESTLAKAQSVASSIPTDSFQPVTLGLCPQCGAPVKEGKKAFSCYVQGCPFFMTKTMFGRKISPSIVKELLEHQKTSVLKCKNVEGKEYNAALAWDSEESKIVPFFQSKGIGECPRCKKGQVVENKVAFGCDRWKGQDGCKFAVYKCDDPGTSGVDEEAIKELLEKKQTTQSYHFKSRQGKVFKARLRLSVDGKVDFIWPPRRKRFKRPNSNKAAAAYRISKRANKKIKK